LGSQRKYNIFVVQLITIGKGVAGIALWSEGRRTGCTTWEKVSIVAEDKEASSAKTWCVIVKKSAITKAAVITKNKVIYK